MYIHIRMCIFYMGVYTYIYIYIYMKPARGPQTDFFSNSCNESQGLPTMKCQTKCAKAILGGRFLGTVTAVPRGTAVTGQLGLGALA